MGEKAYATQTKKAKKDEEVRSSDHKGILSEAKPRTMM